MNPEQGRTPRVEKKSNSALLAVRSCIVTALEQYQALDAESESALVAHNGELYHSKALEAAKTIVNLFPELEALMTGIDPSTRDYILNKVYSLSSEAQHYIDKKVYAGVGVLLGTNLKKDTDADMNELEKLLTTIDTLLR